MKIIVEPTVYLIGRQTVNDEALDNFLADHGVEAWGTDTEVGGEILSEVGGRLCYMSFAKPRPGGSEAYLGNIKQSGHGSVLEHAVWNLLVVGISRTCSHELVRHRAGFGFSQLSQRYVDESIAEYVCPDVIATDPELYAIWLDAVERSHAAYLTLVEKLNERVLLERYMAATGGGAEPATVNELRSWALTSLDRDARTEVRKTVRQAARSVLPGATETKLFITANARALRHFIELRGSAKAEPEIRKLAAKIMRIMQQESPNIFGDYRLTPEGIETPYEKV